MSPHLPYYTSRRVFIVMGINGVAFFLPGVNEAMILRRNSYNNKILIKIELRNLFTAFLLRS